jgi:hypothetical protein
MKEPESDDPMELHGTQCCGDPGYMVDCIVEEYLRMGSSPEQILRLFRSPLYPPLHQLWRTRGPAVEARIRDIAARCGVFRFRTSERAEQSELVAIAPLAGGGHVDE